jgi:hypothetical protein
MVACMSALNSCVAEFHAITFAASPIPMASPDVVVAIARRTFASPSRVTLMQHCRKTTRLSRQHRIVE